MRNAIIAIALVVAIIGGIFVCMSMTKVGQGEVGVVWTAANGVQKETLSPGIHFVHPLAKVKDYPVAQQQLVLSNNPEDYNTSNHADWHVDAPADGGMVKMNLTINYEFMPDRVVGLYTKFNGMDGETIVENMVQNSIIAYIKEVTPKFSVMDIYSTKRSEVSQDITEYLNSKLNDEYGIHISSALIIDVQLDETLQAKIQAKEQAKQDAEKAELDRQTAIAQAETDKVKAQTKADIKVLEAEAEAKANELLEKSLTDKVLQEKYIDKWNGKMPTVVTGDDAGIMLPSVGK
jgi:regulator of protease activity HflC (stomatin/prohibitin superfamily)